ncbi:hypothetical protein LCGC14_2966030 [marine sediment metagenome]|uniref:Uncharacterized protein n=1 Tax=marine sediment metagenome TaxID=412755 RepID=A0A0F9A237_9ZZZZ
MATKMISGDKACWLHDMMWFMFHKLSKEDQEAFWSECATNDDPPLVGSVVRKNEVR